MGRPQAKKKGDEPSHGVVHVSMWAAAAVQLATGFSLVSEAIGPAGALLAFAAVGVKSCGSHETQDAVVRGVFFAENGWALPATVAVLVLHMLVYGPWSRRRRRKLESVEMKRLATERDILQERLLGPLRHAKDENTVPPGHAPVRLVADTGQEHDEVEKEDRPRNKEHGGRR